MVVSIGGTEISFTQPVRVDGAISVNDVTGVVTTGGCMSRSGC